MKKVVLKNSYGISDVIKMHGGTFRASDKVWLVSQDAFLQIHSKCIRPGYSVASWKAYQSVVAYSEI